MCHNVPVYRAQLGAPGDPTECLASSINKCFKTLFLTYPILGWPGFMILRTGFQLGLAAGLFLCAT